MITVGGVIFKDAVHSKGVQERLRFQYTSSQLKKLANELEIDVSSAKNKRQLFRLLIKGCGAKYYF